MNREMPCVTNSDKVTVTKTFWVYSHRIQIFYFLEINSKSLSLLSLLSLL